MMPSLFSYETHFQKVLWPDAEVCYLDNSGLGIGDREVLKRETENIFLGDCFGSS